MKVQQEANDKFPVHEELDVIDGKTIYRNKKWWKAVVLIDGYSGREVGVYLWKQDEEGWKRKQKYVIRSEDAWNGDREIIENFVGELAES